MDGWQRAFVLHSRPWSETSLMLDVFTEESGRVRLVAKGARSKRSNLKGALQPFTPLLVRFGGRGEVKTAHTVCYEILRELLREARLFNAREFRILGNVAVIDIFLDEESQGLAMLSDFIGKPISLQAEPSYSQEQYDIVLL